MTSALSPVSHSVCNKLNLLCPKIDFNLLRSKKFFTRNLCTKKITSKQIHVSYTSRCLLRTSSRLSGTAARPEITGGLSKQQAQELTLRLNQEERALLLSALQEFQSNLVKDEYLGMQHKLSFL